MRKKIQITTLLILISIGTYTIYSLGIEPLREGLSDMGPWTALILFFLRSTSIVIPALPSTAYSLLSGALLGFQKGLMVICFADLFSCTISFFLSRLYGRGIVRRLVGKRFLQKVEELGKNNMEGNFLIMTGFLMTGLFDFASYGIGLTKVKWNKFACALIISILLSNPPIVALGAGILSGGRKILIVSALAILALGFITKKITGVKVTS